MPANQVDFAWRDGANSLVESCNDECTVEQLKLVISRNERQLVRMDSDGVTVGWGVFKIDQFPNFRVLHITNIVAHNSHFELFFDEIKSIAASIGCSRIRCCAKPSQARLYSMKAGFKPIYTTMETVV